MLKHGFDMHRIYISGPGDLNAEKQACREAISNVNENSAMPAKVLLVSVGLPQEEAVNEFRSAVSDNIRQCSFYIQIFEDDWGPRELCRKLFDLACDARHDDGLPMREVLICLKDAPRETDPQILAFRKELQELPDVTVFPFTHTEQVKAKVIEVASGWVSTLLSKNPQSAQI